MKKEIYLKHPHYFFFCIVLSSGFYLMFPSMRAIPSPWNLLGILLMAKGLVFLILAGLLFRKHKTTERFDKSTFLVVGGLYKFSRNPMYLGAIIFLTGLAILFGNALSFASPVLFFLVVRIVFIPFEEKKAEKEFGQDYLDYKRQTRRWF